MSENYFSELEKIANDIATESPTEPMVEDPTPSLSPEEVETAQAANADEAESAAAQEQLPPSPEDEAALQASLEQAQADLQAAEEQLAQTVENYGEFEKTAGQALNDSLPAMGAFAKLIDFSTNKNVDPVLHKLAQERLQAALTNEDQFIETLQKTAHELFEDEENLKALYSVEGMEYVNEQLASFENDDELTKLAFDAGNVVGKVVETIKDYGSATKNFFTLKDEINKAKTALDEAKIVFQSASDDYSRALRSDAPKDVKAQAGRHMQDALKREFEADDRLINLEEDRRKGAIVLGTAGAGAAAGSIYGGKKLYDAFHPDVEIDSTNPNDIDEGGNIKMAKQIVQDFLKVAGAASLINIANDEGLDTSIRKEAADQFNTISRLGRQDMDDAFVKVATQLYTEDQLHNIVAGHHTEELFDKVAFFLNAYDASADELEKVAGADGVAAKGVAGSMHESRKNIEEHIKEEKEKSETQANGRRNVLDPGDTSAYNVVNNPEKYKVEKTAMLEQAVLQKQAAIQAYAEAEEFIKQYR